MSAARKRAAARAAEPPVVGTSRNSFSRYYCGNVQTAAHTLDTALQFGSFWEKLNENLRKEALIASAIAKERQRINLVERMQNIMAGGNALLEFNQKFKNFQDRMRKFETELQRVRILSEFKSYELFSAEVRALEVGHAMFPRYY